MSTIEHITNTNSGRLPLHKRILELMYAKGDAYSVRAFSQKLGISREYLRLMVTGSRAIPPKTLEKIAEGLGVSVHRLRQLDTVHQEHELTSFFNSKQRTKPLLYHALSVAMELVNMAIGANEYGYALNNLGRVQYLQGHYDSAHETWLHAFVCAKKLQEQFAEKHLLHLVSVNLMLTYTIRKEYSNMEELLTVVEGAFVDDPEKLGMAQYTRMKVQEERGNIELAKQYAYKSLEFFEQTQNNKQIGRAMINIAHYEYLSKNYKKSASILAKAIETVKHSHHALIHAVKEYAKSLVQLREYEIIIRLVDDYIELSKDFPEYWAKLQIVYSTATGDPSYAETVKNDVTLSIHVRYLACRCLMELYYLKGDAESAMRYYEHSRIFSNTKCEYLIEGVF